MHDRHKIKTKMYVVYCCTVIKDLYHPNSQSLTFKVPKTKRPH